MQLVIYMVQGQHARQSLSQGAADGSMCAAVLRGTGSQRGSTPSWKMQAPVRLTWIHPTALLAGQRFSKRMLCSRHESGADDHLGL